MAREDFLEAEERLKEFGIVRICEDVYMKPNSRLFVKSPSGTDRTWSLKLYPASGSFCDYSANVGGGIMRLVAYVRGCNNWEALNELRNMYGLPGGQQDREEQRRKILKQQEEQRRQQERYKAFQNALFGEIDRLKTQESIYTTALNKGLYEPFSDAWLAALADLQKAQYRLDVLCAADESTYRRMKPDITRGIGSDRPKWLLDVLAILTECGAFQATQAELEEIKAQRAFELIRSRGADRRCGIEW